MLNREPGAFAGFGLDRNGAAQILGDRAADRQSESDAFDERIGLVESFENPVQMLLRDALSGVVDEQFDLFAPLRGAEAEGDAAFVREFRGVVDEVVDDLLEPRRVGDYQCVRLSRRRTPSGMQSRWA